jgi:epsin
MTSQVVRSIKNVAKGYSQAQIKVREATSNDAWGPTGTQMSDIAHMTFGQFVSQHEAWSLAEHMY